MWILGMLTQRHHHLQLALLHDIVGLAHVTQAANKQTDVLNPHTARSVPIGDIMAGEGIQLGAEEPSLTLASTRAIPMETHDIYKKMFQLRRKLGGHQHDVTQAPSAGKIAAMAAPWHNRVRSPFLPTEQLMPEAHRVKEADQRLDTALLA